ncbi:hypothetical protein VKT23_006573 [Stygiomarasmius scandens]|uniref:F-box domain-containing protein n=1 Tax=Marasmiellus scandens TaxID=2682957 RepID=A0ABR1JN52_9AGAR
MGLFYDSEHYVSFDLTIPRNTSRPIRSRPTSSLSTLPHIPLELVLLILQHAHDKRTYASASLVCRAWSLPAQQFLFHNVSLSSQSACLSFLHAISSSPALASSVRSLSASIDHNQPYGLSQRTFAKAFSLCLNLDELRVSLYGCAEPGKDIVGAPDVARMRRLAPSWDDESLDLLSQGPGSTLTKLRFCNWSDNRDSLGQLLGVFPSVQHLVLTGTPPELPAAADSTPLPPSLALRSLRVNFQSYPSPDYFQWLLHTSSLNSIAFDRVPPAPVLELLLNTHRESLESLYLPSFPVVPQTPASSNAKGAENALISSLASMSAMKSLAIESPESFLRVLASKSLPASLETLSFGLEMDNRAGSASLRSIVDAVRTKESLTELRVMMFDVEDPAEARGRGIGGGEKGECKHLASLKMLCATRGIELGVERDVRRWRERVFECMH